MSQSPIYYAFEHVMMNLEKVKKKYDVKMNQRYKESEEVYCYFDIDEETRIWCVMPPKDFPNHLLSIRFAQTDSKKLSWNDHNDKKIKIKELLLRYEQPFLFDFSEDVYLGVYGKKKGFGYLIYRANSDDLKPSMLRTYLERFENRKGEPMFEDIEIYQTGDFYSINKQKKEESLESEKNKLNEWYTPRWISKQDLYMRWIPIARVNGNILNYFSEEVRFKSNFNDEYDDIFRSLYAVMDTLLIQDKSDFKTAEEFFYVYEDKYPSIRQQLFVYDEDYLGEKLEKFSSGEKVIVERPSKEHQKLTNQTGEVVSINKQYVKVLFMDYFIETFHANELKSSSKVKVTN